MTANQVTKGKDYGSNQIQKIKHKNWENIKVDSLVLFLKI